jgi:hypothetical protein
VSNTAGAILKECEGDCDVDTECEGDLVCFHRSSTEDLARDVPGCEGEYVGANSNDYCYSRPSPNFLHYVGDALGADSYGLCEGGCDTDADCKGDLVCREGDGLTEIEGCDGGIYRPSGVAQNYCTVFQCSFITKKNDCDAIEGCSWAGQGVNVCEEAVP